MARRERAPLLPSYCSWDNVTIQVVQPGQGWHPGLAGGFVCYDFENLPSIVFLEHYRSSAFVYEADIVAEHRSAEEWVRSLALSPQDSADLIGAIVSKWST